MVVVLHLRVELANLAMVVMAALEMQLAQNLMMVQLTILAVALMVVDAGKLPLLVVLHMAETVDTHILVAALMV